MKNSDIIRAVEHVIYLFFVVSYYGVIIPVSRQVSVHLHVLVFARVNRNLLCKSSGSPGAIIYDYFDLVSIYVCVAFMVSTFVVSCRGIIFAPFGVLNLDKSNLIYAALY